MKIYVIKEKNGIYKIPRFIRFLRREFKFECNGKLYNKEIKDNKEVRQVSLLVEALNIKNKKKRLDFIYEKTCELLDDDFYGKNICEFKNNKCIHDRLHNASCNGCCMNNDGTKMCKYLDKGRCKIKCLACKFHICYCIRQKGYKCKINDIYMLKYLYNWKQKIIIYNDFFMTKEEVLNDVYKNSIIAWTFKKTKDNWIEVKKKD